MRRRLAALLASLSVAAGAAAAQDAGRGERLFDACRSCHSLDPARGGMAGPHLRELKGRPAGSAEGFDYSPAFRAAKAQGWVWDEEKLSAYLADPDAVVRGGWMSAPGLDAAESAAVAAFLMRSGSPPSNSLR